MRARPTKQPSAGIEGNAEKRDGNRGRLEAIQALRAIAALLVVANHSVYTYSKSTTTSGTVETGNLLELGVPLFFTISGLLMMNALIRSPNSGRKKYCQEFLRRRVIRIVPLYWAVTLMYSLKLGLEGSSPTGAQLIKSMFFIPYEDAEGQMRPVLGLGWTLNYEVFFYAICAGCVLVPARTIRKMLAPLILLVLYIVGQFEVLSGPGLDTLNLLATPYLIYFLIGCILGLVLEVVSARGLVMAIPLTPRFAAIAIIVTAYAGYNANTAPPSQVRIDTMLVVALLIAVSAWPTHSGDANVSRFVSLIVYLGDASYSIYLTHGFILGPAGKMLVPNAPSAIGLPFFMLVAVPISAAAGSAVYAFFEKPVLNRLNRRYGTIASRLTKGKSQTLAKAASTIEAKNDVRHRSSE